MRYENHILAAQITHIHFEKKKKTFFKFSGKIYRVCPQKWPQLKFAIFAAKQTSQLCDPKV